MTRPSLSRALLDAYRETTYLVRSLSGRSLKLRIGKRSRALDALLARHGVRTAAFVTAFNPYSERATPAQNEAAAAALEAQLRRSRRAFVPAQGLGCEWDEPGVLVLGITEAAARRLGRRYRQNAIVFVRLGRAPKLAVLG